MPGAFGVEDILKYDGTRKLISANLDIKNPSGLKELEYLPPQKLLSDMLAKEQRVMEIMEGIQKTLRANV